MACITSAWSSGKLALNFSSCCLRLMLLPEHCFKPQAMMSSREWEAELKCSATGNPRDWFRMLRRCSLKCSRRRLPVSPMYRQLQRWREIQYTTFSDWQVKWSRMLCVLFGPCKNVWGVMCLHVCHRGRRQGNEPATVGDGSDVNPRFLFTMDIKSVFTVIPHNGGLQALSHFFDQRTNKEPPTHSLTRLAELVLTLISKYLRYVLV